MPIINTSYFQTGTDTSDATATASQILAPYTAYVASGKVTGTIQSQGAQTITPGTSNQTIQSGKYLSGAQTILGDSDLIPGNIKSGVSIFGVSGELQVPTGLTLSGGQISLNTPQNQIIAQGTWDFFDASFIFYGGAAGFMTIWGSGGKYFAGYDMGPGFVVVNKTFSGNTSVFTFNSNFSSVFPYTILNITAKAWNL